MPAFGTDDTSSSSLHGQPLIFGEVLYDCFPDGNDVLGGAPFNVAWHLQGFGLRPRVVSRVGDDPLGQRVLDAMAGWGMTTEGVQRDPDHPTGQVRITMEGSSHRFEILPDQAYDFIAPDLPPATPSLLYHGSLAARNPVSRTALDALKRLALPTFVDINLRAPWWDPLSVEARLAGARWVKINDEELALIEGDGPLAEVAQRLRGRLGCAALVVTRGDAGALIVTADGVIEGAPVRVAEVVDTVGAGDAFASVVILGLHRGWELAETLARALEFGAELCRRRGATIADPATYQELLNRWNP
ncbi:carbohydrate kinase family protein [Endothiovibrio diazotrophicus]